MLIDTASSQLLGASLQGVGPGQGAGRVVAAVNVVVVQDGVLVGVGALRTSAGGGRGHGGRSLRGGRCPLGGPARSPGRRQNAVDNITNVVAIVGIGVGVGVGVVVIVVGGSRSQGSGLRRGRRKGGGGSHRSRSDNVLGLLHGLRRGVGGGGCCHLGLGSGGLGEGDIAPVGFVDALVHVERRTPDSGRTDGTQQQCRTHVDIN